MFFKPADSLLPCSQRRVAGHSPDQKGSISKHITKFLLQGLFLTFNFEAIRVKQGVMKTHTHVMSSINLSKVCILCKKSRKQIVEALLFEYVITAEKYPDL
jgi:hypothetical protein